jgi:hypothetical protein
VSIWIDPRDNPTPPYSGAHRPLARDEAELAGLIAALKQGRFYDAETWVRGGRPLQVDPQITLPRRRRATALQVAIRAGQVDVARLLLCNGYRTDLEPDSPLDAVLEARRWDLLELLGRRPRAGGR